MYAPLPASRVTLTRWYLSTSASPFSPVILNLARASLITCSDVIEPDTGMVRDGLATLRRRAHTLMVPLSHSLSL